MILDFKKIYLFNNDAIDQRVINSPTTIKNIEWEKKELLDREREMLGFFVSEDPLEGYGEIFRSESTHSVIELMDLEEDEEVNVAITGLVSNVQKKSFTKRQCLDSI